MAHCRPSAAPDLGKAAARAPWKDHWDGKNDRPDFAMSGSGSQVTGVILAGGQSRRMGGGDKGLLELAGKPMLAHVIERLAPQVGRLVINANGDPARFASFGLPVVA